MRQLLHISDIHFGPPHLPEVSTGVLQLVERRRPDLVVVSGDLTQRAKPWQFRQARELVDRLAAPSLCVPGNHDVPMYRFWERLLDRYGAYRRHFAEDLEPVFADGELLVVGINTAHGGTIKDGRVHRGTLRRVARLLDEAPADALKVVVAHHPLIPAPRFDTRRVLHNAYEAADLFTRSGVELVLSGHLHQTYLETTEAYYPSGRRPVLLLQAGTTTSSRGRGSERHRNTCNWIRADRDEIVISHLHWEPRTQRFLERSRHCYPRRLRQPYAITEVIASNPAASPGSPSTSMRSKRPALRRRVEK